MFPQVSTVTEKIIVLGNNNDGGWNQKWIAKSNEVRLLAHKGDPAQQWEADFVEHNYDFALLPGFPGDYIVRKVRVETQNGPLSLNEVEVFDNENVNRALTKTASQSSTWTTDKGYEHSASLAVDGDLTTYTHTNGAQQGKYHC